MAELNHEIIERYDPEYHEAQIIAAEHLARYRWAAGFAAGATVLDVACGAGYGCTMLAEAGAKAVVGADLDAQTIETARERVPPQVTLTVADICSLPFEDGTFDLVICLETIEHVEEPERAIDELRRVMTADGVLVISSPNRGVLPDVNPFHLHEYTHEELEATLSCRFKTVSLRRQRTWVGSGVLDDEAFTNSGEAPISHIDVRKVTADTPGDELYTIAMASNGEIPQDDSVMVMTSRVELTEWHRLWHEQHEVLEGQKRLLEDQEDILRAQAIQLRDQASYIESTDDERRQLRTALLDAERELAQMAQLQSDFDELLSIAREEGRQHELAAEATEHALERVEGVKMELEAAWEAYAQVVHSRSWKITGPIRIVGALARLLK